MNFVVKLDLLRVKQELPPAKLGEVKRALNLRAYRELTRDSAAPEERDSKHIEVCPILKRGRSLLNDGSERRVPEVLTFPRFGGHPRSRVARGCSHAETETTSIHA